MGPVALLAPFSCSSDSVRSLHSLSQDPPAVRITFNPEPVPREGFPNWDEERREKKGRPLRGLHVI